MAPNVWKVVLTGGPCSGKTTTLASVYEKFSAKINVICVPETATMTFRAGCKINPASYTFEELVEFTKELVKMQMHIEDYFTNLARITKQDTLLIMDRGTCDTFAYCSVEVRNRVLEELGLTKDLLSEKRYDLVLHLVTVANGAIEFYNLENNARSESLEQAIGLDSQIQRVWMEHSNFKIIDNSVKGFYKKIERVFNLIGNFINVPQKLFVKKLRLPKGFSPECLAQDLECVTYEECFTYLKSDSGQLVFVVERVRL